jgi:replicative DNA helicase
MMENRSAEASALVELFTAHDPFVVLQHLSADDFTTDTHRDAFKVMRDKAEGGVKLRSDVEIAALVAPIQKASAATMRDSQGLALVKSLKRLTQRRKLHDALLKVSALVGDFSKDPAEVLQAALDSFEGARDTRVSGGTLSTLAESTQRMHLRFEEAFKHVDEHNKPVGFSTGLPALDNLVRFKRGNFVVIGGNTGSGKTAMALSMARGMIEDGTRVCYLCREMQDADLAQRLAAQISGENGRNFDTGKLTIGMGEYRDTIDKMIAYGDQMVIGQPKTLSDCLQMMHRAREMHGSQVFFVDYLQQMRVPSAPNPREATMRITDACKFFALENDCVVAGLAQLNRESVKNSAKPTRPRVWHLQESAALEQDADLIFLLWNPGLKDKAILRDSGMGEILLNCDAKRAQVALDEKNPNDDTRCALYCDKYRGGEIFRAVLGYNGPRTLFYNEPRY